MQSKNKIKNYENVYNYRLPNIIKKLFVYLFNLYLSKKKLKNQIILFMNNFMKMIIQFFWLDCSINNLIEQIKGFSGVEEYIIQVFHNVIIVMEFFLQLFQRSHWSSQISEKNCQASKIIKINSLAP